MASSWWKERRLGFALIALAIGLGGYWYALKSWTDLILWEHMARLPHVANQSSSRETTLSRKRGDKAILRQVEEVMREANARPTDVRGVSRAFYRHLGERPVIIVPQYAEQTRVAGIRLWIIGYTWGLGGESPTHTGAVAFSGWPLYREIRMVTCR